MNTCIRFFILTLLVSVAHADPTDPTPPIQGESLDRIVAIVNDGIILKSQLDIEVARITTKLQTQKTELPPIDILRKQVLEHLITDELQTQRAQNRGIKITDDMLNAALNDIATRNNVKFSELPATLEAQGYNYADFRDEIRRQIAMQALRQHEVIANINITPRELDQFLARQQRMPEQNAEYNLSHILIAVPVTATADQVTEREQQAQEIYTTIKTNNNFAEQAVTHSDSNTNIEGGALGWRKGSQLPSIIVDRIASMKAGDVTPPIRTPSGFHLFRLNEIRGGTTEKAALVEQVHARHILIKTDELHDDAAVEQRLETIRERIVNGEDFATLASTTSQDVGSAVQGGDLDWTTPGTFTPEFEQQLDALEVNQISKPFKTDFGWHIVQLLGRRTHDMSDENRRNRAYTVLQDSKAEEEIEQWILRLRSEAYIEYL